MNRSIKMATIALGAIVVIGGGVSFAAIPSSSTGMYVACVKNAPAFPSSGHDVRMLDKQAGESCPSGWTEKSWNQVGPQGPPERLGRKVPQVILQVFRRAPFIAYGTRMCAKPCQPIPMRAT